MIKTYERWSRPTMVVLVLDASQEIYDQDTHRRFVVKADTALAGGGREQMGQRRRLPPPAHQGEHRTQAALPGFAKFLYVSALEGQGIVRC